MQWVTRMLSGVDSYPVAICSFWGREDWILGWIKARGVMGRVGTSRALIETGCESESGVYKSKRGSLRKPQRYISLPFSVKQQRDPRETIKFFVVCETRTTMAYF